MDANQLIDFFNNSEQLAQQDYQELKSLVLKYPYCANLHLLLLEKSVFEDHPDLEKNLSRAAITGIDRNTLRQKMKYWEDQVRQEKGLEDWEEGEEDMMQLDDFSPVVSPSSAEGGPVGGLDPENTPFAGGIGMDDPSPSPEDPATWEKDLDNVGEWPDLESQPMSIEDDLNFDEGKIVRRLAEESLEEKETLVTEALADLFARQGHNKKAIALYEQLRLNIPEKSDYFAGKIEALKD